jgi:exodeoxyribonuclease VII large subunit
MTWSAQSSNDPGRHVWAVGALLRALADALQARFNPVTVRGEVSGFSRAASGHCYFSLKDEQGQLRCAMFRRAAQLSGLDLRDGQMIEATGRLDIYSPRGDLQFIVESARLAGQGSLFEQFMRLKAELEAQGFFDPARKRPLLPLPRSVGVVTSLDAAALRDVVSTLRRRVPHLPVKVFASPVQGDAAPAALCQALDAAYQHHQVQGGLDVLLLVRGGGSLEDLWAFNSPMLVRKLAEAPMPVICGVGHETDFTLADFVADVRAPTPTAAAELCAPSRDTLLQVLIGFEERLGQAIWRALDWQAQRLDRVGQRLGRPSNRLAQERTRLLGLAHRVERAVGMRLDRESRHLTLMATHLPLALGRDLQRHRQRVDQTAMRLALLDPKLVLQRGYAWLSDSGGHAVSSVENIQTGQALQATLADGQLDLTVTAARS